MASDTASLNTTTTSLPAYEEFERLPNDPHALIRIPIRAADLERYDQEHRDDPNPLRTRKPSWHHKMSLNRVEDDMRFVAMSREDYQLYWVKDEDGNLAPHVIDPPEGRKEWVRKQLLVNEQWTEELLANDEQAQALKSPGAMAKYLGKQAGSFVAVGLTGPLAVASVYSYDKRKQKKERKAATAAASAQPADA